MIKNRVYFYNITDKFQFGRHKDQELGDVILDDPTYIYWCVNTIPNFGLNKEVIKQISELYPNYIITEKFKNHIGDIDEFDDLYNWGENDDINDEDYEAWNDYSYNEEPTYDRYNGSWAQDEMGYSDDDIDTIFDGEPDAYWNID